MDEDELEELGRRKIATVSTFDTFGHEAEEQAKRAMLSSMQERPGLSVGIIKDLIAPVPDSVGECLTASVATVLSSIAEQLPRADLQSRSRIAR